MTQTKKTRRENQKPDFIAYYVPDQKNAFWTRIGAAWEHKDGEGFQIELEVPVVTKKIVLRKYEEPAKKEETKEEE